MSSPSAQIHKALLEDALLWFDAEFHSKLVSPIESQFANFQAPRPLPPMPIPGLSRRSGEVRIPPPPVPGEIQQVFHDTATALQAIRLAGVDSITAEEVARVLADSGARPLRVFRQAILPFRRSRAARTEELTEKTVHPAFADALEQDVKSLDALVGHESFRQIAPLALPRLQDYLPVQYIEATSSSQTPLLARQFDEKFHILQAPNLFLPDLAHFRVRCEDRGTPLAIAFVDIDGFKALNTAYTHTKVDRNLLPRFMQGLESHVFHHGFAYRQGGDEYLLLMPNVSKPFAIAFLEELRLKLARLQYPEIATPTTVSIGVCVVEPDCSLTDRELRDRAARASVFAKNNGKNCLATYDGPDFAMAGLQVAKPSG